jgi:broad specificity phosphatase PhoE
MTLKRVCALAVLAASLLVARPGAAADQVIFLVRHAERADAPAAPSTTASHSMLGDDPPLSPAGEQRAARLAAMLAGSNVKQIFTSEFKRTRQTAAPLAAKLKLTPVMAAAKDPDPLVAAIRKAPGNVLVVGHANTVPDLIRKLGVTETVTIGDNDYDNLFLVVRSTAGTATLVRLKY